MAFCRISTEATRKIATQLLNRHNPQIDVKSLCFGTREGPFVMITQNYRAILCLLGAFVLTFLSVGCGSSGNFTPRAAVVPTSHPLVAQYSIENFQAGSSAWVEFGPDNTYGRQTSAVTDSVYTSGGEAVNI